MPTYIQARNVKLTFRPPNRAAVSALDAFDIDVEEGEFLSIVGPSGCGKSTFLNALLGLIKPDSGEVMIRGRKINGPGSERAMVFQEFGLLPWRTVQHNIELGLELKRTAAASPRPNGTALTVRSWSKSPLSTKSTNPTAICSGVVKNSGLSGTTRKIACQAAKNSTTAIAPSIALWCRCMKIAPVAWDSLAIVQITISSLSVFQISSLRSLNCGVTRISYSRGRGSLMSKIFLVRPGRLLMTRTRSDK